jgi:hypothetical protein
MENKINRRNFLKTGTMGAAGFSLIANSVRENIAAENTENVALPESISNRRIFPLNHGWLYSDNPETGGRILQIAMRTIGRNRSRTGIRLGAGRRKRDFYQRARLF